MGRKLQTLTLTQRQYDLLLKTSLKRSASNSLRERIQIVLKSYQGESQTQIAFDLKLDYETVRLWRNRWIQNYALLTQYEQGIAESGVPDHKLEKKMLLLLKDAPRKGTPRKFSSEQDDLLVALACESPTDYGLIRTNWTHETLAEIAVSKGIFPEISARTVGKLLKKKKLQPHKNEYWLFPRISDWNEFVTRVALICQLILETVQGVQPKRHLLSIDEKTSIQALERLEGRAPASKGGHKRREFEYKRHGTTCLIAALDIGTGKISHSLLNPTRTEADFAGFVAQTIDKYPPTHDLILMTDSLNTHVSETLVRLIAQKIGDEQDLGIKGKSGILHNQITRKGYLETQTHRIRFLLTPKHCSWLNPIENWFAKLQRQALTHGNFKSVDALNQTIEAYIDYYNRCLVQILKWKFKGFDKKEYSKAA